MSPRTARRSQLTSLGLVVLLAGCGEGIDLQMVPAPDAGVALGDAGELVLLDDAGSLEIEEPTPDPSEPELSPDQTVFVWQGFRHEWLRTVAGFRVPHRVSFLESYLDQETAAAADFHFGQSTGVDGNFMRPEGRWAAFRSPGLTVERGEASFAWTDDGDGGSYPQAVSERRQTITVALPPGVDSAEVFLRGIRLDIECRDELQPASEPCNSNGMWPFHVSVRLLPCDLSVEGQAECEVELDISRAWTPNRGGLPGLEEKPFNDRLSFDASVLYTVVAGGSEVLRATRSGEGVLEAPARQDDPQTGSLQTQGVPGMGHGVSAITGFGFTFVRTGSADNTQHLGRYIGTLDFGVDGDRYDPELGSIETDYRAQVWIPDTVVATDASYRIETTLLQLGHPDADVVEQQTATGSLCSNSSPEAPWLTRWERCGSGDRGAEQRADTVPVAL